MTEPLVRMRVWGDLACFTRPEFKVERVSYPVITPSAARGCLEAVLWKPAMTWRIKRIRVLKPIVFTAFKRNEVTSRMSLGGTLYADEDRAQRNTVALRNVAYVVEAGVELTARAGPDDNVRKFIGMFERRLDRGQMFQQPYLGCREFAAFVAPASPEDTPIQETRDLGRILYDIKRDETGEPVAPIFFPARLVDGVIDVPSPAEVGY